MRIRENKLALFLLVFCLGAALRLYNSTFFEFKNDQLQAVQLGNQARAENLAITHGIRSGVGVNNPPLFIWIMAGITALTQNLFFITLFFTFANIIALFIASAYFYKRLEWPYSLITTALLSFSPAFIIYSGNIWAQCLLPPVMVLFQICLYALVRAENKGRYFISLGILAAIASQLHLSGIFLFPLLFAAAAYFFREIKKVYFLAAAGLVILIYLPYLYNLLCQNEAANFMIAAKVIHRKIYWKLFRELIRMSSFDFLRAYFKPDFNVVLGNSVGRAWYILYPLACVTMALFGSGVLYYIYWLVKGKRLFDTSENAIKKVPLVFQAAGFTTLGVVLGFFICRVEMMPHYLIVLFPCYSIISGYIAARLWKFRLAKILIIASILANLILITGVLLFLNRAGGHPREYAPHYRLLLKLKKEARLNLPPGSCAKVSIDCAKGEYCDKAAMLAVIQGNDCPAGSKPQPVNIFISWNKDALCYEYSLKLIP